jgi:hypothetical protein
MRNELKKLHSMSMNGKWMVEMGDIYGPQGLMELTQSNLNWLNGYIMKGKDNKEEYFNKRGDRFIMRVNGEQRPPAPFNASKDKDV